MKTVNHAELSNKLEAYYQTGLSMPKVNSALNWYSEANEFAHQLVHKYSVPLFKVVGIIAALSPNNKWERNKKDAETVLSNPSTTAKVCTFPLNLAKAIRIYHEAIDSASTTRILNGRKTTNFFNNIYKHKYSQAVTVDLWMLRASNLHATKKNIDMIESIVKVLAKKHKIMPHQYQAVVWYAIRGSV